MKLSRRKLEQLKKQSMIQEIVKVFSFAGGDGVDYEDFDFTPEVEYTIGVNNKKFVRCNPKKLPNFIESMRGENSYVVPSKRVIADGNIPENVSVIVKADMKKYVVREVIGSQVANWFNLNTCYNCAVNTAMGYDMISVDMIDNHEKLFTFYELKPINCWGTCEEQLEVVGDMLSDKNLINHKITISSEQKEKIIEDYVYSHLVRRVLFSDDDFGTRNCGILYNKGNRAVKVINFDYEYIADPKGDTRSNTIKDIAYISRNYPNIFNKFLEKVAIIIIAKKGLYETLQNYPQTTDQNTSDIIKEILDKLFSNIDKIIAHSDSGKNILKNSLKTMLKEQDDYAK